MICPLVPVEESPTGYKFLEITLSSIALKGFLAENRRAILVSSSLKSPSSDTARQESHQPASPALRPLGRLHSDRYRTMRSPLARGPAERGLGVVNEPLHGLFHTRPSSYPRISSRQARFDDHRILPPHPSQASSRILRGPSCVIPPVCLFFYAMQAEPARAGVWNRPPCPDHDRYCRAIATFSRSSGVMKWS